MTIVSLVASFYTIFLISRVCTSYATVDPLTRNTEQNADIVRIAARDWSKPNGGIPTLSQVIISDQKLSVSICCHILLYYGLGPTDIAAVPSGTDALNALLNEQTATNVFGESPFVRTRRGLRYRLSNDPVFHSDVGESHQDQCLATFAALDLPLETPIVLSNCTYAISDLLDESIAIFDCQRTDLTWAAIAYAKYLPPKIEWTDRFGTFMSFSILSDQLLQRDLNRESCAGLHILQALVCIEKCDRAHSILTAEARQRLDLFLTDILHDAMRRQNPDGSWPWEWCGSIQSMTPKDTTTFQQSIHISGHFAEILNSLQSRRRPSEDVYLRVAEWLKLSFDSPEISPSVQWVCPFTHAALAAREIVERKR